MNEGKVIVQANTLFASPNVRYVRLPSAVAKLLRKTLAAICSSVSAVRRVADVTRPYATGAVAVAAQNKWVIVSGLLVFTLYKRGRKSSLPKIVQIRGTLTDAEVAELKALTPSQISAALHNDEVSCLIDSLDRVVIDRVDLIATELVALPFFQEDQKLARELYVAKRQLLATACGEEGLEAVLGKKWQQLAAWRQQLASTTEAVDMGLQRASFVQEIEWKDIKNWQKKLKLLEAGEDKKTEDKVKSSDPIYKEYQKWEAVIG